MKMRTMRGSAAIRSWTITSTVGITVGFAILSTSAGLADVIPGLHAPGLNHALVANVDGARAARFMFNMDVLRVALYGAGAPYDPNTPYDPDAIAGFREAMQAYRDDCYDLIATIRIIDPSDPEEHFDFIPPMTKNPDDQWYTYSETLTVIERFFVEFGDLIRWYQVGNEIFGGPGTYVAETIAEVDEVFLWFDALVEAAQAGAAAGGHAPLKITSPSLPQGTVRAGLSGRCSCSEFCDPNCPVECFRNATTLNTYRVYKTIEFGNSHDGTDVHLHAECVSQMEYTIELLRDPNNAAGLAADQLTCYEWSASQAARKWLNDPLNNYLRAEELIDFYERAQACHGANGEEDCSDPNCTAPPTLEEWDNYVAAFDAWMQGQLGYGLDGFAASALELMNANAFEFAMYAGVAQKGFPVGGGLTDIYYFDVTKLLASKTTACLSTPAWSSHALAAFESAALNYTTKAGDIDCDGDVDLDDFGIFADCLVGPGPDVITLPSGCDAEHFGRSDIEGVDGDVDLADFATFQVMFGG